MSNFNSVESLSFKELIWNQAEEDTAHTRISSLTQSFYLIQNRHYQLFSLISAELSGGSGVPSTQPVGPAEDLTSI